MAFARPLLDLQDEIAERIADDDALIGLHVISQDEGDIDTQVDAATAGVAYGVFLVIEVLRGTVKSRGLGAWAMDVNVALTVQENVTVNRAQTNFLPWDYVIMALLTLLSPWGNANQLFEAVPDSFEVTGDTGGVMSAQIQGKSVVGWVRV